MRNNERGMTRPAQKNPGIFSVAGIAILLGVLPAVTAFYPPMKRFVVRPTTTRFEKENDFTEMVMPIAKRTAEAAAGTSDSPGVVLDQISVEEIFQRRIVKPTHEIKEDSSDFTEMVKPIVKKTVTTKQINEVPSVVLDEITVEENSKKRRIKKTAKTTSDDTNDFTEMIKPIVRTTTTPPKSSSNDGPGMALDQITMEETPKKRMVQPTVKNTADGSDFTEMVKPIVKATTDTKPTVKVKSGVAFDEIIVEEKFRKRMVKPTVNKNEDSSDFTEMVKPIVKTTAATKPALKVKRGVALDEITLEETSRRRLVKPTPKPFEDSSDFTEMVKPIVRTTPTTKPTLKVKRGVALDEITVEENSRRRRAKPTPKLIEDSSDFTEMVKPIVKTTATTKARPEKVNGEKRLEKVPKQQNLQTTKQSGKEQKQASAEAMAAAKSKAKKAQDERRRLEIAANEKVEREAKEKEEADEEQKRLEEEFKQLQAQAEAGKQAEEEQKRLEEERKRLEAQEKAEAEAKKRTEEEQKRLEAEAEAKKQAEEEQKRLEAEAEAKKQVEEEKERIEKAEAEVEVEAMRKAEEEKKGLEAQAKADEEERKKAQAEAKAELEAKERAEEERKRVEAERKEEEEKLKLIQEAKIETDELEIMIQKRKQQQAELEKIEADLLTKTKELQKQKDQLLVLEGGMYSADRGQSEDAKPTKPKKVTPYYTPKEYRSLSAEERKKLKKERAAMKDSEKGKDTVDGNAGGVDTAHPILGPVIIDLGYKRVHLVSSGRLGTIPIWKKQRTYRSERAQRMADEKADQMELGFPGIICLYEDTQGKLSILDGQHRVGMMQALREKRNKIKRCEIESEENIEIEKRWEGHEEYFQNVLVEVYSDLSTANCTDSDTNESNSAQQLYLEINKAEPLTLVDIPGVATETERKIILEAVESLRGQYNNMFSSSQRCRSPNVNIDNLRNSIFGSNLLQRHKKEITSGKKLADWLTVQNAALGELYERDPKRQEFVPPKAWKKASANGFYLGLESSWLYK